MHSKIAPDERIAGTTIAPMGDRRQPAAGPLPARLDFGRLGLYFLGFSLLVGLGMTLGRAAMPHNESDTTFASVDGKLIVTFAEPETPLIVRAALPHYRVDCSATNVPQRHVFVVAAVSPVVLDGLASGEEYDCHAARTAGSAAPTAFRVRVLGNNGE
jgi:hypothetical protein